MPICEKCYSYYVRGPCPFCAEKEGKSADPSTGTTLGTSTFPSEPKKVNSEKVESVLDSTLSAQAEGYSPSESISLPKLPEKKKSDPTASQPSSSMPLPTIPEPSTASNVKQLLSEVNSLKEMMKDILQRLEALEERVSTLE
ncbi:MAG: hypothetical protein ACFFC7_17945 [Candidatus Hermodarchaeota archaeon]